MCILPSFVRTQGVYRTRPPGRSYDVHMPTIGGWARAGTIGYGCGSPHHPSPSLTYHVTKHLQADISINMTTRLEVGSQGKLGGQSHVPDFEGIWFELVRNVCPLLNFLLAPDLNFVRSITCVCP